LPNGHPQAVNRRR